MPLVSIIASTQLSFLVFFGSLFSLVFVGMILLTNSSFLVSRSLVCFGLQYSLVVLQWITDWISSTQSPVKFTAASKRQCSGPQDGCFALVVILRYVPVNPCLGRCLQSPVKLIEAVHKRVVVSWMLILIFYESDHREVCFIASTPASS